MTPAPGTTARAEYDSAHGEYDSQPAAGRDEVEESWRCPERVKGDTACMACGHFWTPHYYCPHVEHYCDRLEKFISCVEIQ